MLMLSNELINENSLLHVRDAAGLALKNALTARVSPHPSPSHRSSSRRLFIRRVHDN